MPLTAPMDDHATLRANSIALRAQLQQHRAAVDVELASTTPTLSYENNILLSGEPARNLLRQLRELLVAIDGVLAALTRDATPPSDFSQPQPAATDPSDA